MWAAKLRGAFGQFDRNKDGFLDSREVQNIFSDTGLTQLLQNGFYQPTPQDRPTIDRLDRDGDGKVSFAEYLAYYQRSTALVFRTQPVLPENPTGAAVTAALFKLMDTDKDGKLTKKEVKAIEHLLATRDSDEDECLSQSELVSDIYNPNVFRGDVVVVSSGRMISTGQPSAAEEIVVTYDPGRIPGTLTQQVIKQLRQGRRLRPDARGDWLRRAHIQQARSRWERKARRRGTRLLAHPAPRTSMLRFPWLRKRPTVWQW